MADKRRSLSNILIVIGVLFIAIPSLLTYLNNRRNEDIIDQFLEESENAISETDSMISENVESFYIPGDWSGQDSASEPGSDSASGSGAEAATQPGADIGGPASEPNPATSQPSSLPAKKPIMSKEEIKKRMTGVLIIDKIDLRMVIMDGVDEETLRVAAGRMPETDQLDEIGNCVLAGHRSYTFGKYFNRLDELEAGDKITVHLTNKTLQYEITKKFIVEPTDFSIAEKNDTDKILTLFTCHPVAIATHRLVVQAKQTE